MKLHLYSDFIGFVVRQRSSPSTTQKRTAQSTRTALHRHGCFGQSRIYILIATICLIHSTLATNIQFGSPTTSDELNNRNPFSFPSSFPYMKEDSISSFPEIQPEVNPRNGNGNGVKRRVLHKNAGTRQKRPATEKNKVSLDPSLATYIQTGKVPIPHLFFDARTVEFIPHVGSGEFETYLSVNLNFEGLKETSTVLEQILKARHIMRGDQTLLNRGEAHLTVIDPKEYYHNIRPHLSMSEINRIFRKDIQGMVFKPKCIGRVSVGKHPEVKSTYYIVVDPEPVLTLRAKIAAEFVRRGGHASSFSPYMNAGMFPHITIGFDHMDLFDHHGVFKGADSCEFDVVETLSMV